VESRRVGGYRSFCRDHGAEKCRRASSHRNLQRSITACRYRLIGILSTPRRKALAHAYALDLAVNPLRGIDSSLKRSIVPTRGVGVRAIRSSLREVLITLTARSVGCAVFDGRRATSCSGPKSDRISLLPKRSACGATRDLRRIDRAHAVKRHNRLHVELQPEEDIAVQGRRIRDLRRNERRRRRFRWRISVGLGQKTLLRQPPGGSRQRPFD
jgi:hypothetical protein